jgi:hypothetical protein
LSDADQPVLNGSVEAFLTSGAASRFFFVCLSPRGRLDLSQLDETRIHLWTTDRLAAASVAHGLASKLSELTGAAASGSLTPCRQGLANPYRFTLGLLLGCAPAIQAPPLRQQRKPIRSRRASIRRS